MNLETALKILKENLYFVESKDFAEFDHGTVGKYAALRKKNREAMTAKKSKFDDPGRYNDHMGKKWLNVNDKSFETIAMAALDGLCDTARTDSEDDYKNIKTKEDLLRFLDENPKWEERICSEEARPNYEDDSFKEYIGIWPFLKQFMSKGKVRVYRGVTLTSAELKEWFEEDKYILTNKEHLIKKLNNENKEFNSYSVDIHIAENFAGKGAYMQPYYVILSADADNKDINWAFSAYLMGRHCSTHENELNINNSKVLSNIKIQSCHLPKHIWELEYDLVKDFGDFYGGYLNDEESGTQSCVLLDGDGNRHCDDEFSAITGYGNSIVTVYVEDVGYNFFNLDTGKYLSNKWFFEAEPFYDGEEFANVTVDNTGTWYKLYTDGTLEENNEDDRY